MFYLITFFVGAIIAAMLTAYGTYFLISHALTYFRTSKEDRDRRKNDLKYVKILLNTETKK